MSGRQVGDREIHPIGLGCGAFGFASPSDDEASIATIHAALDSGIELYDTALAYTNLEEPSNGERILSAALRSHPAGANALVATKGGHWRAGESDFPKDGRPEALRQHCEQSLRSLGVQTIGLYQLHWPDPAIPFLDSVGGLAELQREGKILHIGLSNVSIEQIEAARSIAVIASVQNHFSPLDESHRPVLEHCTDHGIAYLAWSPLGSHRAKELSELRPDLSAAGQAAGVSTQRAALAWLLDQSPVLIPLVGARRPETVQDSALAAGLVALRA